MAGDWIRKALPAGATSESGNDASSGISSRPLLLHNAPFNREATIVAAAILTAFAIVATAIAVSIGIHLTRPLPRSKAGIQKQSGRRACAVWV